jgi:glycosyltransferase involved in cell wall biosynthesis
MRILYLITRSDAGGAQRHLLGLIRALRTSNEIAVVTGQQGFLVERAQHLGAQVFVVSDLIRSINPYHDILALVKICRIVRDYRPDIVHAHCSKAGLLGRLAAWYANIPSVYNPHGWRFVPGVPIKERFWSLLGEWIGARFGGAIITLAESEYDRALRYHIAPQSRLSHVQHGIPDCNLRANTAHGDVVNLVMVGRFVPQKDHITALRALVGLPENVVLLFAGDGPTIQHAQAVASRLGLEHRVKFLGSCSNVSSILAASHICILASHYEGLPATILEAIRAGLPVVASDVGGVRDCVIHGQTGFLVPPRDPGALRAALSTLVAQPALRASMGAAGRRLFESRFTVDVMIAKTCELYYRLTGIKPLRVQSDERFPREFTASPVA